MHDTSRQPCVQSVSAPCTHTHTHPPRPPPITRTVTQPQTDWELFFRSSGLKMDRGTVSGQQTGCLYIPAAPRPEREWAARIETLRDLPLPSFLGQYYWSVKGFCIDRCTMRMGSRSLKDDQKLGHAEMSCDGKDAKDLNWRLNRYEEERVHHGTGGRSLLNQPDFLMHV